jgi:hypothetical protein
MPTKFTVAESAKLSEPFDPRWVIVGEYGEVLDDASGYGYKSKQSAIKSGWYKFGGGRGKVAATKGAAKIFLEGQSSACQADKLS